MGKVHPGPALLRGASQFSDLLQGELRRRLRHRLPWRGLRRESAGASGGEGKGIGGRWSQFAEPDRPQQPDATEMGFFGKADRGGGSGFM